MHGADMDEVELDCRDGFTQMRDTDLYAAKLHGASMMSVEARGAIFNLVDLTHAHLTSSVLSHVELRYADLTGTVFQDVDLTCADLEGADLTDAQLLGETLIELAHFTSAFVQQTFAVDAVLTQMTELHPPNVGTPPHAVPRCGPASIRIELPHTTTYTPTVPRPLQVRRAHARPRGGAARGLPGVRRRARSVVPRRHLQRPRAVRTPSSLDTAPSVRRRRRLLGDAVRRGPLQGGRVPPLVRRV
jgi:hypothetical protein